MKKKPNDRLIKTGNTKDHPIILASADIKIPDKEVHLMNPDEKPPEGDGTCSCHSVSVVGLFVILFQPNYD